MGLITRHKPPKNFRNHSPVQGRRKLRRRVRYCYTYRELPNEVSNARGIHNYEMYDGDDDEAFVEFYQAETRRKCRSILKGVLLLLKWTRLPFINNIPIRRI